MSLFHEETEEMKAIAAVSKKLDALLIVVEKVSDNQTFLMKQVATASELLFNQVEEVETKLDCISVTIGPGKPTSAEFIFGPPTAQR